MTTVNYNEAKENVSEFVAARRKQPGWLLSHPADIHCVVFQLFVVLAYAVAFYLYLHPGRAGIDNWYEMGAFVVAAIVMLGWISGINVGVNFHNHVHLRIFRYGWLNRWFGRFWAITGGWPSAFWKYSHVTVHHADTLGPNDWTLPKQRADGSFEPYWKYCFLHWPWRYAYHLWKDYRSGECGPTFRQVAPQELLIFAVLYAIPFVIDPLMGLLLWVAPHFFANVLIMASGMYAQHVECERQSDEHPFRHSNTFFSRFFNLTMFNIGYHNLHHCFAHVHWYDLPEAQRQLQAMMDADDASAVSIGYFRASVEFSHGGTWSQIRDKFPATTRESNEPAPAESQPSDSKVPAAINNNS